MSMIWDRRKCCDPGVWVSANAEYEQKTVDWVRRDKEVYDRWRREFEEDIEQEMFKAEKKFRAGFLFSAARRA